MKIAFITISALLLSLHFSQAAGPTEIRKSIKVGDAEEKMIPKWEGMALKSGVLTWGGTGNHRLILALPDGKQITFEVKGPYLSKWARITAVGEIEPIQNWKNIPGIEIVDLPTLRQPDQKPAEQDGADQPATAPESKSEGKDKPQPESKPAPR